MEYCNGCSGCNGWQLAQQAQAFDAEYGMGYSFGQSSSSDSSATIDSRMASRRVRRTTTSTTNPGSWGHPEACRKPCLYFSQGICHSGVNCGFCHMPHFVVTSGLDKRQRELISEMPHQEVVALVYPHLRARAESSQFPEECHKVLSVVCLELPARIRVFLHQDVLDRLNRVLDHLSFSSLISLICKKYDRQPFAAEVSGQMDLLRFKVAHLVNL